MGCGHSSNPNPPSEPAPALHPNTTVAAPDNTPTPTQADNQTPKAEHTTGEEKTREIATSDPPQSAAPPSAASSSTAATSSPPAPATVDLDRHLDEAADLEHKLRNNMSAPVGNSASGDAADASAAPPAWKSFTPDQLAAIDDARAAVRAKGPLVMDPKGTYGLICRACTKPNSTNVTFCTGCSFPSTVEDIQRLPDNIFLLLVQGQDIGATVCYRDADTVCFNDKFPVSENHLDIIPTEVYADVTVLGKEHIPMLERLYEVGKKEFESRALGWLPKDEPIENFITAGYNFPVSVKHLHLHMVLPPFKHEKVFQYPRWHAHTKIVSDLRTHGKVQLYCDQPNDAEGEAEYQRAMSNSERAKTLKQEWEQKQAETAQTTTTTTDAAAP